MSKQPPEKPVDTSPKVCVCDGTLVSVDPDLGVVCCRCGRRKKVAS